MKIILCIFMLLVSSAFGNIYYVSPDGDDSWDGSKDFPWRTIQHAVNSIEPEPPERDNIFVAEGYYEEDLVLKDYINVYGGFQKATWDRHIQWYPTFISPPSGALIQLGDDSVFGGFIIHGGLKCSGASPDILNCRILMSSYHGIECVNGASPRIIGCSIRQCPGNGIDIHLNSSPEIRETVIAQNWGSGVIIYSSDCSPVLDHVTVADNLGAGVYLDPSKNEVTIDNSIIWSNNDDLVNCHASHSCVSDGDDYPGVVDSDPLFFGWGGYNENQPLYAAPWGGITGSGNYSDPVRHIAQVMSIYSYELSLSSPLIDADSQKQDMGAFPEPEEYQAYFGNTAKLILNPGTYYDYNVIVTVPIRITGLPEYNTEFSISGKSGFAWEADGAVEKVNFLNADKGIMHSGGQLNVIDCVFRNSVSAAVSSTAPGLFMDNDTIENSSAEGIRLQDGECEIRNTSFLNNGTIAISCRGHSKPVISNCEFTENQTSILCTDNSQSVVIQSDISLSDNAGAVVSGESDSLIVMSRVHDNSRGIQLSDNARLQIFGSEIYDNAISAVTAENESEGDMINNTIAFNGLGVESRDSSSLDIRNCVFHENAEADLSGCLAEYSRLSSGSGGTGNIFDDPLFVNAAEHDFHLSPGSPCIDAGIEKDIFYRDIDNDARPAGGGVDMGADEAPGLWNFSFQKGAPGWKVITIPSKYSPPESAITTGALQLICTDTNTFGFWDSTEGVIPVNDDELYFATFRVKGNTSDLRKSPGVRLRLSSPDSQWIEELSIFSMGYAQTSPPPHGRDYTLVFSPPERNTPPLHLDNLIASFDMVNLDVNDVQQGSLNLEEISIYPIQSPQISEFKLEKRFEFNFGSEGWTHDGPEYYYNLPDFEAGDGILSMKSRTNWDCFGFWETEVDDFYIEAGRFYRVDFVMRTDVKSSEVPSLRLRVFTENNDVSICKMINSTADASVTLTNYNRAYSVYFIPPQEYATGGANLKLACDLINFNLEDNRYAIIGIDKVEIYSMEIPK